MSIEKAAASVFQMSDAVWERHANPWSVWTRYLCLPLLALAIWSRAWIGVWSLLPLALTLVWIWINPRVFGKPASTDHWASRAVLGERLMLAEGKANIPRHHQRAIAILNTITFSGFVAAIYGLYAFNVEFAVFGTLLTMIGKTWFLDRMVWLYQDLRSRNEAYERWLY